MLFNSLINHAQFQQIKSPSCHHVMAGCVLTSIIFLPNFELLPYFMKNGTEFFHQIYSIFNPLHAVGSLDKN